MTEPRRRLWSSGVNVRPSTTGMLIASKYPGVARRTLKTGGNSPSAGGNSSMTVATVASSPRQRQRVDGAGARHAGNGFEPLDEPVVELRQRPRHPRTSSPAAAPLNVSTSSAENPGSTERSASKLRTISPEPTTSTNASATCVVTSALRVRCRVAAERRCRGRRRAARPSSSSSSTPTPAARRTARAASTDTTAVNASAAPLTSISSRRGMPAAPIATSAPSPRRRAARPPSRPRARAARSRRARAARAGRGPTRAPYAPRSRGAALPRERAAGWRRCCRR